MSRNFDLLAEIEREREPVSENGPPRAASVRSITEDFTTSNDTPESLEMFRLVTTIFLSGQQDSPRQVVFAGVDGDGESSSVCAHAARILSGRTLKLVCVVDANVRSARLSHIFGIERKTSSSAKSVREQCAQIGPNLWLAGTDLMSDARGELLPIEELKHRLAQLGDVFEYLLIDAPGARASKDAELLALAADAAVLVVEANKTRRTSAAKAKESFEAAGIRLLGTVLNNRSFPIPEKLYRLL
jgi:Mrp family chromosome partitioning ATPase